MKKILIAITAVTLPILFACDHQLAKNEKVSENEKTQAVPVKNGDQNKKAIRKATWNGYHWKNGVYGDPYQKKVYNYSPDGNVESLISLLQGSNSSKILDTIEFENNYYFNNVLQSKEVKEADNKTFIFKEEYAYNERGLLDFKIHRIFLQGNPWQTLIMKYSYNSENLQIKETEGILGGNEIATTTFEYDTKGNLIKSLRYATNKELIRSITKTYVDNILTQEEIKGRDNEFSDNTKYIYDNGLLIEEQHFQKDGKMKFLWKIQYEFY